MAGSFTSIGADAEAKKAERLRYWLEGGFTRLLESPHVGLALGLVDQTTTALKRQNLVETPVDPDDDSARLAIEVCIAGTVHDAIEETNAEGPWPASLNGDLLDETIPDRVSFSGGVAVLERYESRKWPGAVIVKTVLEPGARELG